MWGTASAAGSSGFRLPRNASSTSASSTPWQVFRGRAAGFLSPHAEDVGVLLQKMLLLK